MWQSTRRGSECRVFWSITLFLKPWVLSYDAFPNHVVQKCSSHLFSSFMRMECNRAEGLYDCNVSHTSRLWFPDYVTHAQAPVLENSVNQRSSSHSCPFRDPIYISKRAKNGLWAMSLHGVQEQRLRNCHVHNGAWKCRDLLKSYRLSAEPLTQHVKCLFIYP